MLHNKSIALPMWFDFQQPFEGRSVASVTPLAMAVLQTNENRA